MKRLGLMATVMLVSYLVCGFNWFDKDISTAKKAVVVGTRSSIADLVSNYKHVKNVEWSRESMKTLHPGAPDMDMVVLTMEYDASFETSNPRWDKSRMHESPDFSTIFQIYRSRTPEEFTRWVADENFMTFPQWLKGEVVKKNDSVLPLIIKVYLQVSDGVVHSDAVEATLSKHLPGDGLSFKSSSGSMRNLFSEMEKQTWLSSAGAPLLRAYTFDMDKAKEIFDEASRKKSIALRPKMLATLNNLPKQAKGSFLICNGEKYKKGYITGSIYTIEEIEFAEDLSYDSSGVGNRAAMVIKNFAIPVGQDDFERSLKWEATQSMPYSLNGMPKETSGLYSIEWNVQNEHFVPNFSNPYTKTSRFTLRWNNDEYSLLWKDSENAEHSVELIEILNPEEAFINACVPQIERKNFTGILSMNEDRNIFYLLDPDSARPLVEFSKHTPNIFVLLRNRAPKIGALFTIEFAVSKEKAEILRLVKVDKVADAPLKKQKIHIAKPKKGFLH